MKIKHKLVLSTLGFSLVILFMFLMTWNTTSQQKDDGLVINLAGRQRMLTQRMTKEILILVDRTETTGQADEALVNGIRSTMKIFDMTLKSLKDSGPAPLTLDLNTTEYRDCPATGDNGSFVEPATCSAIAPG